jgi:hypothetical protein
MNILVTAIPADQFFADPVAVPVFSDVFPPHREAGRVDFRLAGLISTWIKNAVVDPGSHDATLFMPGTPESFPVLVVCGAGAFSDLSAPGQERAIAGMIETLLRAKIPLFGLAARDFKKPLVPARDSAEIVLRGLAHGADLADVHSGHTIRLHWDPDEADLLCSELRRCRFHIPSCRDWTIDRAPEDAEWLGLQ